MAMELTRTRPELCGLCQEINLEDLKSDQGYLHHATCEALIQSAETCQLCKSIVDIFTRSIHAHRLTSRPIRSIHDCSDMGPVALHAASRDMDSRGRHYKARTCGPVLSSTLSLEVAVSLGPVEDKIYYGVEYPTLLMFCDPGSIAEKSGVASLSLAARGIQSDPLCPYNISRILEWTKVCEARHFLCNRSIPGRRIKCLGPKRLVDVGLPGQSHIRLVSSGDIPHEYIALSYCWGSRHSGLITTDNSLSKMQDGVELGLFSQTIQDAVIVVRALRMQYLWVDALCIIQQQPGGEDWKEESEKMGQIYGNAYVTIAASSAKESSEGFLSRPFGGGITVEFKPRKGANVQGSIYFKEHICTGVAFTEDVGNGPLAKRAWVKQERILSRRTLDFTSRQIYFTCRSHRESEAGEEDSDGGVEDATLINSLGLWERIIPALQGKQRAMMEGQFFGAWGDVINHYSRLSLTFESDRLPAMQGIASILANVVPGRYLAGLWECNLADGLMWDLLNYPVALTDQQSVPTWSWASVMGGVSAGGHRPERAQIQFIDMDAQHTLQLYGRLHPCKVNLARDPPRPPCRSDRKLKDPPKDLPLYSFTLRAAVGPRDLGLECDNTCRFDGLRGLQERFFVLGLHADDNVKCPHDGLLLRRTTRKAPREMIKYALSEWASFGPRTGFGWR